MNGLTEEQSRRVAEAPEGRGTGLDRKGAVSYHSLSLAALGRGSTESNANHATREETSGD